MDNPEIELPQQKIINIDIHKFISQRSVLSLNQLIKLFLKNAESERQLLSQEYLLSKNQSILSIKQFMLHLKEKVIEIFFYYHFKKAHNYGGIEDETHQDQYIQELCQNKLSDNNDIKEMAGVVITWLNEDEVYKSLLDHFYIDPETKDKIEFVQKEFIDDLKKSNTDAIRNERKIKFDELKDEILKKKSEMNGQALKNTFLEFRLENREINTYQWVMFNQIITSAFNFIFWEKIHNHIISQWKSAISNTSLKSSNQYDYNPYHDNNYDNQAFCPPSFASLPKNINSIAESKMLTFPPPKIPFKRYTLKERGIRVITDNFEPKIQAVLNLFNVRNGEYRGWGLNNNEYAINIENHAKIINACRKLGIEPADLYRDSKLNYEAVCEAFGIIIEPPIKRQKF